ncbi:MAG: two-component system phosphate regulon sensor histidine kinase PhoR [Desulforhopalus sp.]|jgi:two-component system phosphate regulon sensor histidine kinase PhoR
MIKPKKLIWQIFPANVITLIVAIIIVSWYGATTLQEFYLQDTETDLEARAHLLSSKVSDYLKSDNSSGLREYCVAAGRESGTRITVVNRDGVVLADSSEDPDVMDNHRSRKEIDTAFSGAVGSSRRFSKTLGESRIYVAIPLHVEMDGQIDNVIVLRTSVSVASLEKTLARIKTRIILGSLAVLLLAGGVTLLISRNVSRPLEQMKRSAEQFARGDFSQRMLPVAKKTASLEIVTLAASMDRMAELLDEKIQAIVTHRNQLETVFSSMVEAVIAIDLEERVISINEAAAKLFDVDKSTATGKIVQQIVRNVKLQQEISNTLQTKEPVEDEIILHEKDGDRFLQTHVVTLSNGLGEYVGVLVVMNDVTRLRRLENIRRDFVANVSHELRTPITSIQGYVETLLDGALDSREDSEKFLAVVLRQSHRLNSIINDLLCLSRIEEESRKGEIEREDGPLLPVIESAMQTCQMKAEQAGIELESRCNGDITMKMNGPLLEQALVNLIVNAITYSKASDTVTITGELLGEVGKQAVVISIVDTGCGIPKEHLPRLFERFYRSDKARSRAIGGTGLGLAIVKHIAQSHGGTVEVESVEGEGATFSLIFDGS